MSNCYVRFLLVCCIATMIPTISTAQSYAGTMPMDTLFICDYDTDLRVQNNGDERLGTDRVLNYIITATIYNECGNEDIVISKDGVFSWDTLLRTLPFNESCCDEFFIHAISGKADAEGFVDLEHWSLDYSNNATRLVLFGHRSSNDTTQENNERSEEITAGRCDVLPVSGGCTESSTNEPQEELEACSYECPCIYVDTLYLTGWDTIFPTWYVLQNDTVSARTSGDTIFTKLLLDIIPEDSMHIDTIVFDAIQDSTTNLRIFNAEPYINPNEYILTNYRRGGIYAKYNEPNKPILDTIIVVSTCCSIGSGGCGELSKPIRLTINYDENTNTTDENTEEDIICCEGLELKLEGDNTVCQGETTSMTAHLDGVSETVIVGAGTHSISLTHPSGCMLTANFTVDEVPPPSISGSWAVCSDDLASYSFTINTEAGNELTTNVGTVSCDEDFFSINDIPADIPATIMVIDPITGCTTTQTFNSPNCSCPIINSPYSAGDVEICANEVIPALSISSAGVDADSEIRWYNVPTGGVILARGLSFTPNQAGTYFAEVYNTVNGCVSTRTQVRLTINATPIATITGARTVCPGEETILTASLQGGGASSFQWSASANSASSSTVSVGVGAYSVTVTDANGCQDETYVTITEYTVAQASIAGDLSVCPGEQTLLTASGGIHYNWNNFAQSREIFAGVGTYCVSITDANGCESVACVTVTESPLPTIELVDGLLQCAEDLSSYNFQINTEAGNFLSIGLGITNEDNGLFTISDVPADISVTVVVTNLITGCTATQTFQSPDCSCPPIAAPQSIGNVEICADEAIPALSVSGVGVNAESEIRWYSDATSNNAIATGLSFTPTQAGSYYAEIFNTATNCPSPRTEVRLIIHDNPNVVISGAAQVCPNEVTPLYASLLDGITSSFLWSSSAGSSTDAMVEIGPGVYSVTITDANGCESVGSKVVDEFPATVATIEGTPSICPDGTTMLTATGGTSFEWSNFIQSSMATLGVGDYSVTVTDANGCNDIATVEVTENPLPTIELVDGRLNCAEDRSSYSFQIYTEAGNAIAASLGTVSGENGFFDVRDVLADLPVTVIVTNSNTGCENTLSIQAPDCTNTNRTPISIDTIIGVDDICDDLPIQVILNEAIPCDSLDLVRAILISPDGDTLNTFPLSPDCIRGTATSVSDFFLISDELQTASAGTYIVLIENTEENVPYRVDLEFDFSLPVEIIQLQPNNNLCDGDLVTLKARVLLDFFNQYIFTWTRPDGTTFEGETIEVTQSGIYAVEALEVGPFGRLGCKRGLASYEVESSLVIDIPNNIIICLGAEIMICASTNGGGETITFLWSTGDTRNCIETPEGTYSLTATDENGCQDEESVTVIQEDQPSLIILEQCGVDADGNGILVIQSEAGNELTTSSGTVSSYVSGENKIYTISGILAYPLSVEIVNDETGCINYQDITPDCDCPPIAAPSSSTIAICESEVIPSITISTPEGLELCWYDVPVGGEPLFKDGFLEFEEQVYYIAYRDIVTGCLSSRSPFEFVINELPRITITGNTATCGDELTEICANVETGIGVDYQWSDGQNGACPNLSIGTYTVTITDENGCENYAEVEITELISEERFQRETVCEKGEVRRETQIIQSIQGCDSLVLTTEYILEDNPDDCLRLYIPNAFSPNGDELNDVFQIFMNSTIVEEIEMHIFNRYGQEVFFTENKNEFWDGTYQNKPLQPGVFTYVLQILTTDKETYTYAGNLSLIR